MSKQIAVLYCFKSESNPDKLYQTLEYTDGSTSCECKGWVFKRKSVNGERSCKHTRYIDAGLATTYATSTMVYIKKDKQQQRTVMQQTGYTAAVQLNRGRLFDFETE